MLLKAVLLLERALASLDSNARKSGKVGALAKGLSTAYMAMSSATELSDAAKTAGLNARDTGVLYFGMTAALGGLYNSDIGSWPLKQLKITEQVGPVSNAIQKGVKDFGFNKVAREAATKIAPTEKTNFLWKQGVKLGNTVKQALRDSWKADLAGIKAGAISESAEEVIETTIKNGAQLVYNFANAVGATSSPVGRGFKLSPDQFISEIGASAVGGALGGAVFKGFDFLENPQLHTATKDFTQLIIEGRGQELSEQINEARDAGILGSTKLSSQLDENGNFLPPTGDQKSQNDIIADAMLSEVERISSLVKLESTSNPSSIESQYNKLYEGLVQTKSDTMLLDDYNTALENTLNLNIELNKLKKEKAEDSTNTQIDTKIESVVKQLEDSRSLIRDIENLNKAPEYLNRGIFNTRPEFHSFLQYSY